MGKVLPFPYLANPVNRTKRITQALAREGDKNNGTDKRDLYQNTTEDWRIFI